MTKEQLQQRATELRAAIRDYAYVDKMSRVDHDNLDNLRSELGMIDSQLYDLQNKPVRTRTFASFAGQTVDDACRRIREHFAERNNKNNG